MPTVDERLERLFTAAAVEPTPENVFGAVAQKRRQRHTRRVARNIGAFVALLVVLAGSLVWLTTDNGTQPAVSPTTRDSVARKLGDAWLGARPVALTPDVGYVRGPLLQAREYVALAAYDRDGAGGIKVPPSRVVRIDATGHVLDEVELQGEILSFADGEGARWVVTHDADNVANRLYRVKRIAADDSVQSNEFLPGVEPTGSIVAGGGAAWVPVDNGVLRFDAATGAYRAMVSLPGWHRIRLVRLGDAVYTYTVSASQLVRLDAASTAPPPIVPTSVPLVSVTATPTGLWALAVIDGRSTIAPLNPISGAFEGGTDGVVLPHRFTGDELQAAGTTLWVLGRFPDEQSGLIRLDAHDRGVVVHAPPVRFRAPNGRELLGLDGHDVLVAADGELYRVDIR